jgi:hypothetical protein
MNVRFSGILSRVLMCGMALALLLAGTASADQYGKEVKLQLTDDEMAKIHDRTLALSQDLVQFILEGATYDSISHGSGAGGTGGASTEYPFTVRNTAANRNEADRKTAKYTWAYESAVGMGFPVVVRYQPDKFFYAEIGDPEAPEMVFALSHLDSPTASISAANLARWRNGPDGARGENPLSYISSYVKDGWIYGAGVQDDSGPTLATLVSMLALMQAEIPLDRRVRVGMGAYEDGGPGTPTPANTSNYMDIPYLTSSGSFYDNWAYKYLNREEMPIIAFTSDSRFPVVVGNSVAVNRTATKSLSDDVGKGLSLVSATGYTTTVPGDDTVTDIVFGSGHILPTRAEFALAVSGVPAEDLLAFKNSVAESAAARDMADKVEVVEETVDGVQCVVIKMNTQVPMEAPTAQYASNAPVLVMSFIEKAFNDINKSAYNGLALKSAASDIARLFMLNGKEDYFGTYMGGGERQPDTGAALTMVVPFTPGTGGLMNATAPAAYYNSGTGVFTCALYIRHLYDNSNKYSAFTANLGNAWTGRDWSITAAANWANPTVYAQWDNYMFSLHQAAFMRTIATPGFEDINRLRSVIYPVGTTGGVLATDYFNKMDAFGAVLPGNQRWWHAPNERMTIKSAVQMTEIFADGMAEMARYYGPAGARVMWADIPGYNADRADLDLLDVQFDTYKDARGEVPSSVIGDNILVAATAFDIPMFRQRNAGSGGKGTTAIQQGHSSSGIYLPVTDMGTDVFILPERLEFKLQKAALGMDDNHWNAIKSETLTQLMTKFSFYMLRDGAPTQLTAPAGQEDKYFFRRVNSLDPDTMYISVNIGIADEDAVESPKTVLADSKTDLYKLNPNYVAVSGDPWPNRGQVTQRGFFVFGDGLRNARFESPDAIYLTLNPFVSSVVLDRASLDMSVGDSVQLTATTAPDGVAASLEWSSSNASAASVSESGVVTANTPGTTVITVAVAGDGPVATCAVRVDAGNLRAGDYGGSAAETPSIVAPSDQYGVIVQSADIVSDAAAIESAVYLIADSLVRDQVTQTLTLFTGTVNGVRYADVNAVNEALGEGNVLGVRHGGVKLGLPVVSYPSASGKTSVYSIEVSLDKFTALKFSDIVILRITGNGEFNALKKAADPSALNDGEYVISLNGRRVDDADKPVLGSEYVISVGVLENGAYDLDPTLGHVIDSIIVAERVTDTGGGGGGCDSGIGALLLMSSAGVIALLRKKG